MDEEADNDDDLYHDPSNYLNHKKKIEDLGEAGEFFNSIIINNKKERKRLNKYLKKFFDLEIAVLDLNYFKNFSNLEKIKVKQLLSDVEFSTRKFNDKFVMIKDLKFKKKFSIHGIEIGKGPSNIFPFLLQILNDKPNLIFAIQELENNWHPKNHSKLILLLVEILKLSKNKSYILETHSELFILQIQKLVQKGVLKPDDVSINYISRSKDGYSEIINLPLNSNGGFEKKWPGGFFTERMEILTS
jgi:predicted ATPase